MRPSQERRPQLSILKTTFYFYCCVTIGGCCPRVGHWHSDGGVRQEAEGCSRRYHSAAAWNPPDCRCHSRAYAPPAASNAA